MASLQQLNTELAELGDQTASSLVGHPWADSAIEIETEVGQAEESAAGGSKLVDLVMADLIDGDFAQLDEASSRAGGCGQPGCFWPRWRPRTDDQFSMLLGLIDRYLRGLADPATVTPPLDAAQLTLVDEFRQNWDAIGEIQTSLGRTWATAGSATPPPFTDFDDFDRLGIQLMLLQTSGPTLLASPVATGSSPRTRSNGSCEPTATNVRQCWPINCGPG